MYPPSNAEAGFLVRGAGEAMLYAIDDLAAIKVRADELKAELTAAIVGKVDPPKQPIGGAFHVNWEEPDYTGTVC